MSDKEPVVCTESSARTEICELMDSSESTEIIDCSAIVIDSSYAKEETDDDEVKVCTPPPKIEPDIITLSDSEDDSECVQAPKTNSDVTGNKLADESVVLLNDTVELEDFPKTSVSAKPSSSSFTFDSTKVFPTTNSHTSGKSSSVAFTVDCSKAQPNTNNSTSGKPTQNAADKKKQLEDCLLKLYCNMDSTNRTVIDNIEEIEEVEFIPFKKGSKRKHAGNSNDTPPFLKKTKSDQSIFGGTYNEPPPKVIIPSLGCQVKPSKQPQKVSGPASTSINTKYNMYTPTWGDVPTLKGPRPVIIDGSNVAFAHSNNKFFSSKGIAICAEHFLSLGHKVVAFVPEWRKHDREVRDIHILNDLIEKGIVILTPSRKIQGRRITPYDDRFIVHYASECKGIVISKDNYRDLLKEDPSLRETIELRLLQYTWVGDTIIFPMDPLGKFGPNLEQFLNFPQ